MTILELFVSDISSIQTPVMDLPSAVQAVTDFVIPIILPTNGSVLQESGAYEYISGASSADLNDKFISFAEAPYCVTTASELKPMTKELRHFFTTTGNPERYEIRGNRLFLYPTPSADVTIATEEYRRPSVVTNMTDDVPFSGLFDHVYRAVVPAVANGGVIVMEDPTVQQMIRNQVITTLNMRFKRKTVMTSCETF